jgi:2-polyprenyl-6-methoxyphenol hydroxylase-like FAD-dependent oxidoreductase
MAALRIAVVGAGPSGLASALCWHRRGSHVTVFEAGEDPRQLLGSTFNDRTYTIDLTDHGMSALRYLAVCLDDKLLPFRGVRAMMRVPGLGLTFTVEDPYKGGFTGARVEFCAALLSELLVRDKAAGRITLKFGSSVELLDAEQGVLQLGAERLQFDLVVAADGAGSKIQVFCWGGRGGRAATDALLLQKVSGTTH